MMRLFWPALVTLLISIPLSATQHTARAAQPVPLVITTANGQDRVFQVEVAATPDQRERGLMQRQAMALNAGMLFVFDRDAPVAFWMKNTLISLDMLFVRSDGSIAHIHERAIPLDETAIPSRGSIRYVLEINGGLARTLGIRPGDHVTLPPSIGPS
jgi:uncharacterized protein